MDWAQITQMTTAFAAGAAGVATLQKLIERLGRERPNKPLQNGERHSIISTLTRLEQYSIAQERSAAAISGRLDDMDSRLRAVERIGARLSARAAPNLGSTDL